ncbi:MAG: methyltransferase domain-containing protein [Chitinophagaceae bacterium]
MDREGIPFDDIKRNMEELDFINTHLGGHKITLAGLRSMLVTLPNVNDVVICEIGCGGGDNLIAVQKWCTLKKIAASFIGIDINSNCIAVARSKMPTYKANFIASDYSLIDFREDKPDIIFTSLFCHHFTNEELRTMLYWMKANAKIGFFINDLHRHPLAYYSIAFLTKLFSRSYLVKNDAPLSVLRGFTRKEWESLLNSAGIHEYAIIWKWAFRHLITVRF